MKTIIIIYLIFSIPGFYGATGQEKITTVKDTSGWKKIGIVTVYFKTATDEVSVMESERYTSVKFSVSDVPLDIIDLEVFYETGDKQDIKVNLSLTATGETQVIELTGGERRLTKISFNYKPVQDQNNKKAVIELWGLKSRQNTTVTH